MGRPNSSLWKTLGLVILLATPQLGASYGNIGCLFKESLCVPNKEHCFDDYAFGKCVSKDQAEVYKHKLGVQELEILKKAVIDLNSLGFHWSDVYTQCRLQIILYSIRQNVPMTDDYCDQKLGIDSSKGREIATSQVGDLAAVKFIPSEEADFANEIFFPSSFPSEGKFNFSPDQNFVEYSTQRNSEAQREKYQNELKPLAAKLPYKKSYKYPPRRVIIQPDEYDHDQNPPEMYPREQQYISSTPRNQHHIPRHSVRMQPNTNFYSYYFPDFIDYDTDLGYPPAAPAKTPYIGKLNPFFPPYNKYRTSIYKQYNTPDSFRQGIESKDMSNKFLKALSSPTVNNRGFTEGGVVLIPIRNSDLKSGNVDLSAMDPDTFDILDFEEFLGFQRHERLDVKKPGPGFAVNDYAFSKMYNNDRGFQQKINHQRPNNNEGSHLGDSHKKLKERNFQLPLDKKDLLVDDQFERVDTSIAFVEVANQFNDRDYDCLVKKIAEMMSITQDALQSMYIRRVKEKSITFKVAKNPRRLNASEVARQLDKNKESVKKECQVEILNTGIGDETQIPIKLDLKHESDHELFVASLIMCGVFGALLAAAAAYYIVRKNSYTRKKLNSLSSHGTEPSKDYQDLCRARMASKTQETVVPSVRVSKLSQESDSPSSRSSTSSWSEEPALSNMDISTGHMVLSYMEDHLRNKDRLDTEWTALCAYEAEPCSVVIAQLPDNSKKNRYVNALPYDHARVVLNELTNMSGTDYINASTITDHDPRNPAYIATQGPLANTAADMWQMIWEQGCVVIVMLTRLSQNDLEMSFRYWPEEGSELYHIYEVHLVSEHIWCDDYLVRSFYLKNLKTGETRTVTQFHFLSWPDGGVPNTTKALLEFRRKVNKSFRGRSCPIVVHCSDGIGRTGTYCLLDMVLNRMAKGAKEIDIAATLEHIRDQRGGAVSSKQQFQFVLQAVAEEVQAILRVLPQQDKQPPPLTSPIQPLPPPITPQTVPMPQPVVTTTIAQTQPTVTTSETLPQPKSETQHPPN